MLKLKARAVALGGRATTRQTVVHRGTYHFCRSSSNRKVKFLAAGRKTPVKNSNRFMMSNEISGRGGGKNNGG